MTNKQANSTCCANKFLSKFRRNKDYDINNDLHEKYALTISKWVCYRARTKALQILRENLEEHYAKLGSYKVELHRIAREGKFNLFTDFKGEAGRSMFKRIYIGFSGLRKGYMESCKPCTYSDGCFLKTMIGGALLTAVARDENNKMFPISWCVVEGEND